MKISNAITIIALGLQGFLLHTDAAPSYRLRGGGSDFDTDTTDLANSNNDAGYHGHGYGYGDMNPDADGEDDDDFDDFDFEFESESSGSVTAGPGAGVYIQAQITAHTPCRRPFPACGNNSQCRPRRGNRSPICVDDNRCLPPHVRVSTRIRNERRRCCNRTPDGARFCN